MPHRRPNAVRPIRVLVAPNAFKGSCSAMAAARAIARGVADACPGAEAVLAPMADGGDGFLEVLVRATGGGTSRHRVEGPLGVEHEAPLGWLRGHGPRTAVIEMAAVCGLRLVARPTVATSLDATSYGVGQLIRVALDRGARRILLGVGGSASTDGGAGLLQALGLRAVDGRGRVVAPGGRHLARLASLDRAGLDPRLRSAEVVVAVDVANPLLGPAGAARVYGPQKGADAAAVRRLELGLSRWATLLRGRRPGPSPRTPGAGAAGGTAFGLAAGLAAVLAPGAQVVAEAVGLEPALAAAAFVLTGEGRLDAQSLRGKATHLVAARARRLGVPCVVLAGSVDAGAERRLARLGATALPLGDGPRTLEAALTSTRPDLRQAAARAVRLWRSAPPGPVPPALSRRA